MIQETTKDHIFFNTCHHCSTIVTKLGSVLLCKQQTNMIPNTNEFINTKEKGWKQLKGITNYKQV